MSKFEQKPGSGALFANTPPGGRKEGAPEYKGSFTLADGRIIGLALWKKPLAGGGFLLSISQDDREGAYQAKKHNRPQMTLEVANTKPAQSSSRRTFGDDEEEQGFAGDMDDEIPF